MRRPERFATGWPGVRGVAAALAVACASGAVAPAQAQLGILGGYNRDSITDFSPAAGHSLTDQSDGYHLGVFYNLELGPLGIRPGVVYHQLPELVSETGGASVNGDVNVLELPLDIVVKIPARFLGPYAVFGPVFTFPSSSVPSINDALASAPTRFDIGVGLRISLGMTFWPEIRYGFSLGSLFNAEGLHIGGIPLDGEGDPRLDSFMFRLGVSL